VTKYAFSVPAILLFLILAPGAYARDFTAADFDPADPSQAEVYYLASESLMMDLTIVAKDAQGNELFTVTPMPLELVALMSQTMIHQQNATSASALAEIVDRANSDKPTSNSFAFILDGASAWTGRAVAMYYYPDGAEGQRLEIPVVKVKEGGDEGDPVLMTGWAVMAESLEQIEAYLAAPKVVLVVGDSPDRSVELDCGFWRQYSVFDLREDESGQQE
jgi:hypothetical protein